MLKCYAQKIETYGAVGRSSFLLRIGSDIVRNISVDPFYERIIS